MFAVAAQPVALTVSPARAVLLAPASRTLPLGNLGTERMAVEVAWKSLGPHAGPSRWLTIAPRRLVLRGGARTVLTVRARPGASPGDHAVLVLVTGRPLADPRVAVHLRLGVRLRIRRLKGKRTLVVAVANRGNVTEQLRGRLTVTLVGHSRVISRLRFGRSRELFPGARAAVALPYAGNARGLVTALVKVRGSPGERRYRLWL